MFYILYFICLVHSNILCVVYIVFYFLALTLSQMPEHFSWTSSDYNVDDWVWDQSNKSPEVELSSDKESVYFYTDPVHQSTGTAGIICSITSFIYIYAFLSYIKIMHFHIMINSTVLILVLFIFCILA